jgi:hypothetical protein
MLGSASVGNSYVIFSSGKLKLSWMSAAPYFRGELGVGVKREAGPVAPIGGRHREGRRDGVEAEVRRFGHVGEHARDPPCLVAVPKRLAHHVDRAEDPTGRRGRQDHRVRFAEDGRPVAAEQPKAPEHVEKRRVGADDGVARKRLIAPP